MAKREEGRAESKNTGKQQQLDLPPGVKLLRTLEGHKGVVRSVAFDPAGRTLASGSDDTTVKLWETASGKLLRTLEGHQNTVWSPTFDPAGRTLASGSSDDPVKLWDPASGKLLRTLKGNEDSVLSVAFNPAGRILASGTTDKTVKLWDPASGKLLRTLEGHADFVRSVAFDPARRILVSGSDDRTVKLWESDSGKLLRTLEGHQNWIFSVAFDPAGRTLASGSRDKTVNVWDPASGKLLRTLEGHTAHVDVIAFSSDGRLLASKSGDGTVRLWNCETWETVAVIPEPIRLGSWIPALAFHPTLPLLATAGSEPGAPKEDRCRLIHLWELDLDVLLDKAPRKRSIHYKNAKVVLVGDTGVGKSGLALRMAEGRFAATESTHGRRVWTLDRSVVSPSRERAVSETHEILLWDLAGQAAYRLVHQLNIDEAAVALVLVDARSETDPLGPAEYWSKAIDQARASVPIKKFLVESRTDRGGVAVSREDLQKFCQRFGFTGFFSTSAKTGQGVAELAQAVRDAIPWDDLPEVVSTDLFSRIKELLKAEKERGDQVLVEELTQFHKRFVSQTSEEVTDAEFRAVIGRLEASSLVSFLVFTALKDDGERADYVLMQPEYIDAYASAIINQARTDPRGIGHVSEEAVRRGELSMPSDDRIRNESAERLVIGETIEQLLKHDIALRERLDDGNYLVFPSQYTRTSPYPRTNAAGVAYEFDGATRAVFSTLVVRLTHHQHFVERDFWKDAARYQTADGGRCIIVLDELAPSRGRLSVFFESDPPRNEQAAFLRYVFRHLTDKAVPGSVVAHRTNRCPACGHPWDEAVVENRLKLGKPDIVCPNCDTRSPLIDLLFSEPDPAAKAEADRIDTDANAARSRELAVAAIRGKEQFGQYDVFLSYNGADRKQVVMVAEMLKGVGIRPWLDVWDLVPGQPWQEGLEAAIKNVRSAAICVGASGHGPWQDREMRAFAEEFVRRKVPVMPVLLPQLVKSPELPVFLRAFNWVDLRELAETNPRPLANLVAGILGRRPDEMRSESLAEQVVSMLSLPAEKPAEALLNIPEITLPVNRPELSDDALAAVVLQTAQLLGIPSRHVKLVRTEPGSVRVILQLDDLVAVSQLFAMVERRDPALAEFFHRCQIDVVRFEAENSEVPQQLLAQRAAQRERQPDELERRIGKVGNESLREWAGGAGVAMIAIVFTDIVDSTKLCSDLGDAPWDDIRQRHFARVQQLIRESSGFFIKNTGDGVLAAFHNAEDAVTFARAIASNTGHAVVRVRVGVHVGQVTIDSDDAFGRHVNLAARVMSALKNDGVIISDQVKIDLDARPSALLASLHWTQRPDVPLKGVSQPQTLWELQNAP
jgi:small GTP-binding protein